MPITSLSDLRSRLARALIIVGSTLTFSLVAPAPLHAFKVDLHIWIAQQILDDAGDGYLEFRYAGERRDVLIPLPADVARALRVAPEYFRMGSVGPDAFPDVLVGQFVLHPGVKGGWGTAEWLRHLRSVALSDQELAFVMGLFCHAAADVFAHSYVNRYAGDVFDIEHNPTAARRHVLLESFLSAYTPPLRDARGPLDYRKAVSRPDGGLALPEEFVRERMFFEAVTIEQLARSGKVPHVPLIAALRARLRESVSENGFVSQIEDAAGRLSMQIWTNIDVTDAQARQIREYGERIHDMADGSEFSIDVMDGLDKAIYQGHLFAKDELKDKLAAFNSMLDSYGTIHKKLLEAEAKILEKLPLPTIRTNPRHLCKEGCPRPDFFELCTKACDFWPDNVEGPNPAYALALEARRKARELEADILENHERPARKALVESAVKAMEVVSKAIDAKLEANLLAKEYFKPNQAETPLRRYLTAWQKGVEEAMAKLAVANGETIVNLTDHDHPAPLRPLQDWFDCFAPAIQGIPLMASTGVCKMRTAFIDVKHAFDEFERELAKVLPVTREIVEMKDRARAELEKLKQTVGKEVTDRILAELDKVVHADAVMWKKALTEPATPQTLRDEFSRDPSGRGLLVIPDIAARIHAEMKLKKGRFDAGEFPVVRDAIVLAMMATLDADGLRKLALYGGVRQSTFGEYLYPDDRANGENVLYGFARSIDGNHQWQRLAPPHPRVDGYDQAELRTRALDDAAGFTYVDDSCTPSLGMRLWTDPYARMKMFYRLFKGPLVPGVDAPESLGAGFPAVLQDRYTDTVTSSNPWDRDWAEMPDGRPTQAVELTGRGRPGVTVTLAANGATLGESVVGDQGRWTMPLSIRLGRSELFTLQYRAGNRVLGTLDTSYCMATPGDGSPARVQGYITVWNDTSLWHIAELLTGDGKNYEALYKKNEKQIDDKERIYPGQLLAIPFVDEWESLRGTK